MSLRRLSGVSHLRIGLLLGHLALPVGLWLAVRIGRARFVGLAFYLIAATLFVDVLLLVGRPSSETVAADILDARAVAIVLVASAAVLALIGPGLVFYACVTTVLVAIFLRAFALENADTSACIDLTLLCGTSILLISSQVFTVAYYTNVADTINHTTTAMVLRDSQWLSAISSTRYYFFAAFHVLASTGMQFTKISPRPFMGVLMALLFQIALLAGYLFFNEWSHSRSLALIATGFVSINIAFLHYGSIAHYQSMSFVLFCVFLYLLYRGSWTGRDIAVTVPILAAWIATHHVSILIAIFITAVPTGYLAINALRRRTKDTTANHTVFMFLVFCLMFGSYWALITTKFREILIWVFFSSATAEGIPSRIYLIDTVSSVEQLIAESIPFFVDSVHYSFLLALAGIGVLVILTTDLFKTLRWRLILLAFLPAAALYFPSPVWIPLEGLIPYNRLRLMVLPFLVLVPAAGFRYGARPTDGSTLRRGIVVLFTAALVLTTITSGLTHPGLTDLLGIQKGPQEHITNEELAATDFVFAHANDQQSVYSRSDLMVYQRQYAWEQQSPAAPDQFVKMRASQADRQLITKPGLTVVSVAAFRNNGIRTVLVDLNSSRYGGYEIDAPVYASNYRWNRTNTSVVYTNGPVVIQYQ
ncbi:hypothetical protein NDI76_16195 [Halogeometricum sp. S1BR25-6]|uniref:Glycosyltransferase RgtA/B/C/D-like domain-containing protein n=1 Tax=Halogeometricum salsisoli TaxID=2950536 RepID=A0ABU2GHJ8_9EURY|nr:hypothetical protein [Halogeometricum sp. S1BR25-6]MDS0300288.1 hypothetical protein [Halogeometricum sp. S1BR25-6]